MEENTQIKEENNKIEETNNTETITPNDENNETKASAGEEVKTEVTENQEDKDSPAKDKKSNAPCHYTPVVNYKVKVSGLPRFYSSTDPLLTEFKTMLKNELKLDFQFIRSPKKGNSWLYITFTNPEDQERALNLLKRYTWKNRTIICTLVVADVLKRKGDDGQDGGAAKKAKLDIPLEEQMLMSTIPYHTISYEEQLSKKNEEATCHLKWLFELIEKRNYKLSGWIDEQVTKHGKSIPFALEEVKPSPIVDGYRNRCEFRIGINPQNQEVTVGYRVDNQKDGTAWVAPPDSLLHLPKQMIEVVKAFEKCIKESPYPPQLNQGNETDDGVWKMLLVRMNRKDEIMIVVMIHPPEEGSPIVDEVKNIIISYFTKGDGKDLNIVSIFLHLDKDKSKSTQESKKQALGAEHLWGEHFLNESIFDLNFEVTPSFYFHWNTYGAEQLYNAVVELAGVDSETTVLDLCCGSGGMGMTLAKHCKEVIGVELMDQNIEDAKKIAEKNGLTNCEFIQGKVDDIFPQILEKVKGKKVVPILDPPRNGISQKMIVNLRNLKEADKIVYVCSNHKLPLKNLLDLGTVESGQFSASNPFVPTKIIPIDMSPHALRCELVMLCERVDMKAIPKPTRQASASNNKRDRVKKRMGRGRFGSSRRRDYRARSNRFDSRRGRDSLYSSPSRRSMQSERNFRGNRFPERNFNDNARDYLSTMNRFNFDDDFGRRGKNLFDSARGNMFNDFNSRFGNDRSFGGPNMSSRSPGPRGGIPSLFDTSFDRPPSFNSNLSRFSDFRRDILESAIDSSFPPFRNQSFSLEAAILEREKRAFEAGLSRGLTNGTTNFNKPRQPFRPSGKRGGKRGGGSGGVWR